MALEWCVKHGVIPKRDCDIAVKELTQRKAKAKKQAVSKSVSKKSAAKKRKLKNATEAVGDAGMAYGGTEGIGTSTY